MMDESDWRKKRRVRGGHRGAASRLFRSADHEIKAATDDGTSSTDRALAVARLRELRASLDDKLQLLRQLDQEILEALEEEDDIEREVEEADVWQQEMQLVASALDTAVALCSKHSVSVESVTSDLASLSVSRNMPTTDKLSPDEDGYSTPVESFDLLPVGSSSPATTSASAVTNQPTPASVSSADGHGSSMANSFTSNNSVTASVGSQPVANFQYYKLPKLELPKFAGEPSQWETFWDCSGRKGVTKLAR